MRKFIKLICIALSLVVFMSASFACGNKDDKTDGEWQGKGVHEATVKDGKGYFIKNGKTEYSLVIPKDAKSYELKAADYLNDYIKRATGVEFNVITDDQVVDGGKYISLGETTLLHNSGISIAHAEYKNSGFRMLTKNGTLYIAGSRSNLREGTYYGAQEFLKYTIDYKAYAIDEIQYSKKSIIKEKIFDVIEIPEFDQRDFRSLFYESDAFCDTLRLRAYEIGELSMGTVHNNFIVLPPEKYFKDHPDWYYYQFEGNTECSDWDDMFLNGQLCFSNEEMTDEFVNQLVLRFKQEPEAELVHIGTQDRPVNCECKNCKAKRQEYGTNPAGLYLMFVNKVARRVTEEIQKTEPTRNLRFQMWGYLNYQYPPATFDGEKWVLHCDEVIPEPNVRIQFAPLRANITEVITDEKVNASWKEELEGWKAVADAGGVPLGCWMYTVNYEWVNINHKIWDVLLKNYRIYSEAGMEQMLDGAGMNNTGHTYVHLRAYVSSQLMWDLTQNYEDLVTDFISAYYGPAAEHVQAAYDAMCVNYEKLTNDGLTGIHNIPIGTNDDGKWTFAYVESQRLFFEAALESLEGLKTEDPVAYAKYRQRVLNEYWENIFMQMEFYMEKYDSEYITKMINLYEEIAASLGITVYNYYSNRTVDEMLVKWRGANV